MSEHGDPVAWTAIEPGWRVLDAAGGEVGRVDQIVGDPSADIFDGLAIGDGGTVLTRSRYVAAERVASIRRGEIALDLSPEQAAALEPYTQPVVEPLRNLAPEPDETRQRRWAWLLGPRWWGRRGPLP